MAGSQSTRDRPGCRATLPMGHIGPAAHSLDALLEVTGMVGCA